jgi:predicted kinase
MPDETTLFILCGLSFAGKTTIARAVAAATRSAVVSYDRLYATAERPAGLTGLDEWRFVVGLVHDGTRAHLEAGRSVVVDNLNEDRVDRDALRAIADEVGVRSLVIHVDAPLDLILERRRANDASGGRGTTSDEQFEFVRSRFEPPAPPERFVVYRAGDDLDAFVRGLIERS